MTSDLQIQNPQVNVRDRPRQGVDARRHAPSRSRTRSYTAYGDRWISTIYAPNNQYQVILELEAQYQRDPTALSLLYVRSSNGQLVPLERGGRRLTESVGPLTVNHPGQLPAVTHLLQPAARARRSARPSTRSQAMARQTLPATITTSFQGTAQAFQSSLSGLWLLLARRRSW